MHAASYHDAGVARISFDSSWWALQFILDNRGSVYLPEALATRVLRQERIFETGGAPVFTRKKCLVVNDAVAQNWAWLQPLVDRLRADDLHPPD